MILVKPFSLLKVQKERFYTKNYVSINEKKQNARFLSLHAK